MNHDQDNNETGAVVDGASRRKLPRRYLSLDVHVKNSRTGESVGTLVNVHVEGLMLVNEEHLQSDLLYQLTLVLPHEINGSTEINMGVDCLWYNPTGKSDLYWSGCQIIDISDEDLDRLQALIEQLGL